MQHRILEQGSLLDWQGALLEEGYSVGEILHLDSKMIADNPRFVKKYDNYSILSDFWQLHMSVMESNNDVLFTVKLYQAEEKKCFFCSRIEKNASAHLDDSPGGSVVHTRGERYEATFRRKTNEIHLYGHIYDFLPDAPFLFDFVLRLPPDDGFAFCKGFKQDVSKFFYVVKKTAMPADGKIIFGTREILFGSGASFANAEFVRSALPKKYERRSMYLCGLSQGRRIGAAIGSAITGDTSENAFFIDGKLNKLSDTNIQVATLNGEKEAGQPWTVMDYEGKMKLLFMPNLIKEEKTGSWLKPCCIKYLFGVFSGQIISDAGEKIAISNIPGFASYISIKL